MFSSIKSKLFLGIYVFLLLSIPAGAYLASQSQNPNASAKNNADRNLNQTDQNAGINSSTALKDLQTLSTPQTPSLTPTANPTAETSTNFGPIMDFILRLEGRPTNKESAKVFVGIAEGEITNSPKYLLTFSVNLPDDGRYPNLSLAGLTAGNRYSAYLKGPAQIATASAFTMSAFTTHLNDSNPLVCLSGDVNDDNVINDADLTIAKSGNQTADFNLDGLVNSLDFALITKNSGKLGAGGVWTSQPPKPTGGIGALIP